MSTYDGEERRVDGSIERLLGNLEATSRDTSTHLGVVAAQLAGVHERLGCIPGLKKMVEDHETRVRALEETRNKGAGVAMAAGATGGLVATVTAVLALFGFKL